jgi:putative membrane protein
MRDGHGRRMDFLLSVPFAALCTLAWFHQKAPDITFLNAVSMANIAAIESGRMAEGSDNEAVKALARKMVAEHTLAQRELLVLAKTENVDVLEEADLEHRDRNAELLKLNGGAFDSAYVNYQLLDYQATLTLLKDESGNGKDPEARAYATKFLPRLEQQIESIKSYCLRRDLLSTDAAASAER